MDTLTVKALTVSTYIGVYPWEQKIRQPLYIDLICPLDHNSKKDQLQNTVDYEALCRCVTEHVESNVFQLIETVAESVALLIKQKFKLAQVTVNVSKPHAIKNAENVQISVTR